MKRPAIATAAGALLLTALVAAAALRLWRAPEVATRVAAGRLEDRRLAIGEAKRDADEDRTRIGSGYWADRVKHIVWRDGEGPLFVLIGRDVQAADLYGWAHEVPPIIPLPPVLAQRDGQLVEAPAITI